MTPRDLARLVWSNLNRMRGRAIMTALGVLIGTAAIVVLIALASGVQQSVTGNLSAFGPIDQITVYPGAMFQAFGGGSTTGEDAVLTPRTLNEMETWAGVAAVTPVETVGAPTTIKLNRLIGSGTLTGVDPRALRVMELEMAQGTDRLGRNSVVVGSRLGERFVDPRQRDPLDEPLDLYGRTLVVELQKVGDDGQPVTRRVRLRVTGVLAEGEASDDYVIYLLLDEAEDLMGWYTGQRLNYRSDGYSQAIIVAEDPDAVIPIEQRLLEQGFFAFSARSTVQQLNVIFTVIQAAFGGIGAIALLVAAIGIANTMVMSILERTREIGLMKAVGATNRDVMSVFIAEAGAIGVLGGIGGVVFGVGAAKVIDLIAQAYINAQLAASGGTADQSLSLAVIPLWLPVFAIIFSLLIGLISGIYPALRAVQLDPVAALKYE